MQSKISDDYITNRLWLQDVVNGNELILCGVSALEFLELFMGYYNEKIIDVYAKSKGKYDNFNYHIMDTFDGIDFVKEGNVFCTSVNQTFNDMLRDFENSDELALTEALSNYYYSNGESFDGLRIEPENLEYFERIKTSAIEYYSGG